MRRKTRKFLSTLLTLAMVLSLFVALPITASAADGPVTIDVTLGAGSDLGDGTLDRGNMGDANESEWDYFASTRTLRLWTENGDYTLTGTNSDLTIAVMTNAENAKVKLNNLHITADTNSLEGLATGNSCTITLVGSNSVTGAAGCQGLNVASPTPNTTCTVSGDGALVATGGTGNTGIYISAINTLVIDGNATVTAVGGATRNAINYPGAIQIGDNAKLTMTNKSAAAETRTFSAADAAETHIWNLSGSATLVSGALSDDTITVTIPAGLTGTVERIAVPVITLDPTYGPPGTRITVTGANFPPSVPLVNTIRITFAGAEVLVGVVADAGGSFSVEFDIPAAATTFGPYTVTAVDTADATKTASKTFTLACCEIVNGGGPGVNVGYASLADAVAAATTGQTIRLLTDIVEDCNINITGTGFELTIDMAGYDITLAGTRGSIGASGGSSLVIKNGGTLNAQRWVSADDTDSSLEIIVDLFVAGYATGAYTGGKMTVTGDVQAKTAIVTNPGELFIYGDVYYTGSPTAVPDNTVVQAIGGAIFIDGDVKSPLSGVEATWGASVTVTGNIDVGFDGVRVERGGVVEVEGDIIAGRDGIVAVGVSPMVTVKGDVYAVDCGVLIKAPPSTSSEPGTTGVVIIVEGSIYSDDTGIRVEDASDSTVTVTGDIDAGGDGVYAEGGAEVTVEGAITAATNYISIDGKPYTISDHEVISTKPGYLEYTDGTSTVWVSHTHTPGVAWLSDATGHWHECDVCGEVSGFAAHTPGDWIIDVPATAATAGSRHKECTVCGFVTETETIPATGGGGGGTPNYTVTFDSNGGSAVAKQYVWYNNKVIKPADPTKDGFSFAGWFTDEALTNAYDFSKNVTSSFTLYAKWTETTPPPVKPFPFIDVLKSDWFYDDVKTAWEIGLVDGRTPTTYCPNENMTYAEAVVLAARMHQLFTTGKVTLLNGNPWYQTYVDYAKANGIISKDYDWKAPATRAGYVEIFAKALPDEALKVINDIDDDFVPDVPADHPQAAAIYKLYRAGILQGVNGAYDFNPDANIKRSEVAAIITRMMKPETRIVFEI